MKKLFALLFAAILLNACTSHLGKKLTKKSADDVKIENLASTCDCVEGLNILLEDALDYVGNKTEKQLKKDDVFNEKMDKMRDIGDFCSKEFDFHERKLDEIKDCDAIEDLETTMKKFQEKF